MRWYWMAVAALMGFAVCVTPVEARSKKKADAAPNETAAGPAKEATPDDPAPEKKNAKRKGVEPTPEQAAAIVSGALDVMVEWTGKPAGTLDVDVTNALGENVPSRVDLQDKRGHTVLRTYTPEGKKEASAPVGKFQALVYVYESDIPILVTVRDVEVKDGAPAFIAVTVIEGSGGKLSLKDFDSDGDLAMDRAEIECGTSPEDPSDVPGKVRLPDIGQAAPGVLHWYAGELAAHSLYGYGQESVKQLIARAESSGLDFLAITDLNTLASVYDPDFHSEKVVLIPALAWGNSLGEARIYAPKTAPDWPESVYQGQAECVRVQLQGGVFTIGHPCGPQPVWKWGLSYVNAIQAWAGEWAKPAPLQVDQLDEAFKKRAKDGKYLFTLAAAAAVNSAVTIDINAGTVGQSAPVENDNAPPVLSGKRAELPKAEISANTQNTYFWDLELVRGLMACGIASSETAAPGTPMGKPLTYILSSSKSVAGLVEGLRKGRTVMARAADGPFVDMGADLGGDGSVDARIGDVLPLHQDASLLVQVLRAKGLRLQVLESGRIIMTKNIDSDTFAWPIKVHPDVKTNYRARVVSALEEKKDRGAVEVLAMTSPIYAQDITLDVLMAQYEKRMRETAAPSGAPEKTAPASKP